MFPDPMNRHCLLIDDAPDHISENPDCSFFFCRIFTDRATETGTGLR
jgi:hypothetical protein